MVQVLLKAILAAGVTACVVAAAAAGYLSLVAPQERRGSQPALLEGQSENDPPPLVLAIDRDQLE